MSVVGRKDEPGRFFAAEAGNRGGRIRHPVAGGRVGGGPGMVRPAFSCHLCHPAFGHDRRGTGVARIRHPGGNHTPADLPPPNRTSSEPGIAGGMRGVLACALAMGTVELILRVHPLHPHDADPLALEPRRQRTRCWAGSSCRRDRSSPGRPAAPCLTVSTPPVTGYRLRVPRSMSHGRHSSSPANPSSQVSAWPGTKPFPPRRAHCSASKASILPCLTIAMTSPICAWRPSCHAFKSRSPW